LGKRKKDGSLINGAKTQSNENAQSKLSKKEQKKIDAELRKIKAPLTNRLKKIESERLQKEKSDCEEKLFGSKIYEENNKKQLADCMQKSVELISKLDDLEEEWMDVSTELESL